MLVLRLTDTLPILLHSRLSATCVQQNRLHTGGELFSSPRVCRAASKRMGKAMCGECESEDFITSGNFYTEYCALAYFCKRVSNAVKRRIDMLVQ